MNQKQMKEFMKALNAIAEEKKIDKNVVVEAMEQAMAAAYKKNEGLTNVMAKVDDVTGDIRIYSYKTVVETVENPDLEISLEEASKEVEGIELGDTIKDKELPLAYRRNNLYYEEKKRDKNKLTYKYYDIKTKEEVYEIVVGGA